ncbi:MAG TPA: zinc ribbon domain-containing protein [Candidatus Dormibacteraeota bacterium]|jgi:hypothetical protein
MAVTAPTTRFCGRCGAPLAPGAGFCGRCGTPVLAQQVFAPPPPGPPPAYQYARAPRAQYPTGQGKLAPALIAGGLVVVLIVVAVVVAGIAIAQFANGHHSACTTNCAPKIVTPLPEEASFRSTKYNFVVNYSSGWTVRDQDDSGITLGTRVGSIEIFGTSGGSAEQAVDLVVRGLPTAKWQDVTQVDRVRGAHIGDEEGVGAIYSANLINGSQSAVKVRFAVIAAKRGDVTVIVFAVDPADTKSPNGMPEGQAFDYLCTEFSWS